MNCIACGTKRTMCWKGQLCAPCWLETNPDLPVVDRCGCVSMQCWEVKRRIHLIREIDRPPPSLVFEDADAMPESYPCRVREFYIAEFRERWHAPMSLPERDRWALVWRETGATDAAVENAAIDFMIRP